MADFNITREQGEASVTANMQCIKYLRPMAAWEHDCGAWLVVGHLPLAPSVYCVHWRATDMSGTGNLAFASGSFQEQDEDIAWARVLKIAEKFWNAGVPESVAKKAAEFKAKRTADKTKAGKASGEARVEKWDEERARAKELARKLGVILPEYDVRVWEFMPTKDVRGNNVIQFAYKKMRTTFAYLATSESGEHFQIGRAWHPGMSEDNAPISEICYKEIGDGMDLTDDAYVVFAKLLKTDPAQWRLGDYVRFSL